MDIFQNYEILTNITKCLMQAIKIIVFQNFVQFTRNFINVLKCWKIIILSLFKWIASYKIFHYIWRWFNCWPRHNYVICLYHKNIDFVLLQNQLHHTKSIPIVGILSFGNGVRRTKFRGGFKVMAGLAEFSKICKKFA